MKTYTWKIKNLNYDVSKNEASNVVTNIHWCLIGQDDDFIGEICGMKSLAFDPNSSFVSYDDLTEPVIIEWLKSALGDEEINRLYTKIDDLQASINIQVKTQENPTTGNGLPWGK